MATNKLARAEMAKSIAMLQSGMRGGVRTTQDVTALMRLSASNQIATVNSALPRTARTFDSGMFGPMVPTAPNVIDVLSPSGRPLPRKMQYDMAWNAPGAPGQGKLVPFHVMRTLAKMHDVTRRCIEFRKQEVAGIDWDIMPRTDALLGTGKDGLFSKNKMNGAKHAAKSAGKDTATSAAMNSDRRAIRDFFATPDRIQGLSLSSWMKIAMEEVLVVDALSVYEHPTWGKKGGILGSDLFALEVLDGTTIKPLIDVSGRRPQPPEPAFQQFIWGLPTVDLTATLLDSYGDPDLQSMQRGFSTLEEAYKPIDLRADQLAYLRYCMITDSQYGFSNVEQMIMNINIALKRQQYHLGYFTDGDIPAMLLHVPDTWNLDQIDRYESGWHSMLAGDGGWKHRVKAVPGAQAATQLKPPAHNMDFDEFLLRMACWGMDVDAADIGFPSKQESPKEAAVTTSRRYRTSTRPMMKWFQEYFDDIIARRLNRPDLVFRFLGIEVEDETAQSAIDINEMKVGAKSIDQYLADRGREPLNIPQSSAPNVYLTRDVVPLKDVGVLTMSTDQLGVSTGVTATGAPASAALKPAGDAARPSTNGAGGVARANASPTRPTPARRSPAQPSARPSTAQKIADSLNELKQFEKFMEKDRARRFQPEHLSHTLVDEVYERVAEGETNKGVFSDVRMRQAYASDAIIGEIMADMV